MQKTQSFHTRSIYRCLALVFAALLSLQIIFYLVQPQLANAYTKPSEAPIDKQAGRIWASAFAYCLGSGKGSEGQGLKKTLTDAVVSDSKFWESSSEVRVSYEFDEYDGKISCSNGSEREKIATETFKFLGVSKEDFLNEYYTVKDGKFELKDSKEFYDLSDGGITNSKGGGLLYRKIIEFSYEANSDQGNFESGGLTKPGPEERKRRTLVAVSRCIKKSELAANPAAEADGQQYVWRRDSINGNTESAVGQDWQNNGTMKCQTLVDIAVNDGYLTSDVDLDAISEDPSSLFVAAGGNAESGFQGNDGVAADDGQDVCISSGFNLSWILCPIFNGVAEATDWIYRTLIDPFLYTPPVSTDPNTESFKVWSSFRVIGNIVLVIGMLVIVFGQSLGGGLIDAYTAKKILPRIIVAAILINLSVYFVAIAVDVSNILGKGIQQLMFAPFAASGMAEFEISGIQGVVGGAPLAVMGVMLGGLVAGGAAAGGGLIGGLAAIGAFWPVIGLTIILPAVLALLAVFVTLILRRALILFLVMVSPIAFAMYCLPNTEKYFKKWWEYFSKALLVYPIIAIMFALADILAITLLAANGSKNSNGVENGLAFIIAFVIQLIPIFIIPFAFKIAGGAIGSLYGTISGLGKKGSELAKGDPRDPLSARNQAKFKARSALNDTNMSGAAMRTRMNPFLRGANRRARLSSIRDTNQAMLGTDVAQAALVKNASTDDKVMTDLGFFATGKASRDAIDAETLIAMDEAKRNHDITNPASTIAYEERLKDIDATRQQKLAASATADRIGRTSSNRRMAMMQDSTIAYGLKGGEEGWKQAMGVFQELSNGDESQFRSMVNEFQYHAKSSAGRADLAGNVDSGEYDLDRATGSQNLYTLLNSKGSSVKALISQHKARLADPTATDDQKHKSAQFLNEMLGASAKSQGSGAIRDIINDAQADVVQPDGTVIMGTQKILDEHVRQQAAQRVQANPNDAAAWDAEFKAHADSILAQIRDDSREYTPINPNTQGAP